MKPSDDKQQQKPNVDKKELQAFIQRQPSETQKALRKALRERGMLDGKDDDK